MARTLLDEIAAMFGVSFAGLTFVSDDGSQAVGYLARSGGEDVDWWRELRLDLVNEPSGTASAVFEAVAFAVYDVAESNLVNRRLVEETGARSAAFVPLLVEERVIAVLAIATADERRVFSADDLTLMQTLASEAAVALERLRGSVALEEALAENEERLSQQAALLRAAHALSSELDLPVVLQRLADQLADLLDADAADCYLLDRERGLFRCVAVHGFDASLLGFEFPLDEIENRVPHPAYDGFTDATTAPMSWGGEVRGVLGVGRRGGRPFRAGDRRVLEAFSGLASLAVGNAETFTQSARQARIQRGFYRIAAALGQSLSRAATLEAVAQAAAEALGGTSAAVIVPSYGRLEPLGAYELPEALAASLEAHAAAREGQLFRAAAEGRIVASRSIADDERLLADLRETAVASGYRSLLAVPVEAPRGAGSGFVLIFFAGSGEFGERTFSDDDLELARHLADAARGALERSELFEAERSARAVAQQLTRTGRLLTSELDPAAVLDEVVQQAPALVNAEAAAFRIVDGDELVVTAAEGNGADAALESRSPATGRLSGDVVQSGLPVALSDAGADDRLRELDPMLVAGHSAFLGVPVGAAEGAVAGVLAVYAEQPREWREEEIEALQAVAASTSAALSNAELYQRVALERERSVAILANIADGIVAVDREGNVVLWNAAAERITGVPARAALGRAPVDVLQRSLEAPDGAAPGNRLVAVMRGREEVWLSVTEAVMQDPLGGVAGRIFAFRDISGDRLVEQVKSDFVSTVSHELRTPLTSIYGFAETLLRQDVVFGEEEQQTFLRYIASESQRLTTIVDTLLNVARLDTGDLKVNLADTDVREVVGQVLDTVRVANGHKVVLDIPDAPLPARADVEKLRQVFSILVDNAIRYSPDGGTIRVGAAMRDDTLEVTVSDEGIGIPQADQEQIFRKFYRGADAELRVGAGGTGLGLFIARGLVTAMGGRIWVASREGEGSSFSFELPAPSLGSRE